MEASCTNYREEKFFRHVRLHYAHKKKTKTEMNQVLYETYGDHQASLQTMHVSLSPTENAEKFFRHVLLHYFDLKKTVCQTYNLLYGTYRKQGPSYSTCYVWFRRFKHGEFSLIETRTHGRPKIFEDTELETLLKTNPKYSCVQLAQKLNVARSTVQTRLKRLGKKYVKRQWIQG